jgi:hypothetical protein
MHPTLLLAAMFLLSVSFLSGNLWAQSGQASGQPASFAEPLGFLERFALSDQRDQTLAELISRAAR